MCGGAARWLRIFGVDTAYTPGIEDGDLVEQALGEGRLLISSDRKLFERRLFTTGQIRGLFLPVGLKLDEQVAYVCERLHIKPGVPRCSSCNGVLEQVSRAEVGDVVPARSLVWAKEFFRCKGCGQVYWEGSHWRKIGRSRARMETQHIDNKGIDEPECGD